MNESGLNISKKFPKAWIIIITEKIIIPVSIGHIAKNFSSPTI